MSPKKSRPASRAPSGSRNTLFLPLAASTLSLTGCMVFHHSPAAATRPLTPPQQVARQVSDFTAGTDTAITGITPTPASPSILSSTPSPLSSSLAPATAPAPIGAMAAMSVPVSDAPATRPAPVHAAPPPAPLQAAEPTVAQAMEVLRKQAAARPSLTTALALALLDSAQGRAPDPRAARLSAPDQKLLADLLGALQGMSMPISASTTLADRASPLVAAARRWQRDADLAIPKLALASRVDSFGVYTPVAPTFPQGISRTVILYCEVANFASTKADDGWYETHLSQQDTLLTDDGLLIWRPTTENVDDRSMNQRHDFYLVKKITLPDTLAAGKYTLRMSVTDRTTNKIAMVNLPIEITAQ